MYDETDVDRPAESSANEQFSPVPKFEFPSETLGFVSIAVSAKFCVVIAPFDDIDIDRTGLRSIMAFDLLASTASLPDGVDNEPMRFTRLAFVYLFGLFTLILANGDC